MTFKPLDKKHAKKPYKRKASESSPLKDVEELLTSNLSTSLKKRFLKELAESL